MRIQKVAIWVSCVVLPICILVLLRSYVPRPVRFVIALAGGCMAGYLWRRVEKR